MPDLAATVAAAGQSGGTQMRMGTVSAFDPSAGTLTVNVAGTDMPGVFYNPAYLPLVGDTVAVLNAGPTWYVLGSTINTLARTVPTTAYESTEGAVTAAVGSFGDLASPANPGPAVTVTIGASMQALVIIQAEIVGIRNTNGYLGGTVGVQVSGATSITPTQRNSLRWSLYQDNGGGNAFQSIAGSAMRYYTGLNPGSTTFTMKYETVDSGANTTMKERTIAVFPY